MANGFLQPERKTSILEGIGLGLSGFGAGVAGQGQQFLAGQAAQRQNLSNERQRAAAEDLRRAQILLGQGDIQGIQALAAERSQLIEQLGGDPSDTNNIMALSEASMQGDRDALNLLSNQINTGVQLAAEHGLIKLPQQQEEKETFEAVRDDAGNIIAQRNTITGEVKRDPRSDDQSDANALRRRDIELKEKIEKRQEQKLSGTAEKVLFASQDAIVKAQRNANHMSNLAKEYEANVKTAGFKASIGEFLAEALGSEDEVSLLRRNYNSIRASQAMANLPPGPASDKDIALALSGFPKSTSNPKVVASFLRGVAKLSRADAAWNQFRADFISKNRGSSGMNKEWRTKFKIPELDNEVISMGEVYNMAQEEGMTPEEIMAELGIK